MKREIEDEGGVYSAGNQKMKITQRFPCNGEGEHGSSHTGGTESNLKVPIESNDDPAEECHTSADSSGGQSVNELSYSNSATGSLLNNNNNNRSIEKLLECPLCIDLLCEPVTTLCGHSFCRLCLVQCLQRSSKTCPTCRAQCHILPEEVQENHTLAQLSSSLFPESYKTRMVENKQALHRIINKSGDDVLTPIFQLPGTFCLPGSEISIDFFEYRYRIMMKRLCDSGAKPMRFAFTGKSKEKTPQHGDVVLIAVIDRAELEPLSGRYEVDCTFELQRYTLVDYYEEPGTGKLGYCRLAPHRDAQLTAEQQLTVPEMLRNAQDRIASLVDMRCFPSCHMESFPKDTLSLEKLNLWMANNSLLPDDQKYEVIMNKDKVDSVAKYNVLLAHFNTHATTVALLELNSETMGEAPAHDSTWVQDYGHSTASRGAPSSNSNSNSNFLYSSPSRGKAEEACTGITCTSVDNENADMGNNNDNNGGEEEFTEGKVKVQRKRTSEDSGFTQDGEGEDWSDNESEYSEDEDEGEDGDDFDDDSPLKEPKSPFEALSALQKVLKREEEHNRRRYEE